MATVENSEMKSSPSFSYWMFVNPECSDDYLTMACFHPRHV